MSTPPRLLTCLWFPGEQTETAATHYVDTVARFRPESALGTITRAPLDLAPLEAAARG